jgi:hypothetical protein
MVNLLRQYSIRPTAVFQTNIKTRVLDYSPILTMLNTEVPLYVFCDYLLA